MTLFASCGRRTAVLVAAFASALAAGCARTPKVEQAVGETTVTSASGYLPPSVELYLAEQLPAPCGMDRLPAVDFEFGSSDVSATQNASLALVAQCLTHPPFQNTRLVLIGRADPIGSPTHNLELAYDRAASVRHRLLEAGIEASRVLVTSAGEARLPRERWDEARRVDIVLARPGAATFRP